MEIEPGFEPSRPVGSFVQTVRWLVVDPAGFFGRVTGEKRDWPPVLFVLICGLLSWALGALGGALLPFETGGDGTWARAWEASWGWLCSVCSCWRRPF